MKKLLIIPMLFMLLILASCDSCHDSSPKKTILTSNTDYENIIGTPIKIENLEVAQHDLPQIMNWKDAKAACAKLGKGWRLPTKDELNVMYKYKVGGYADKTYWSSTEYSDDYAWFQYCYSGRQDLSAKNNSVGVRAVRGFYYFP